jgi:hypothetical protein
MIQCQKKKVLIFGWFIHRLGAVIGLSESPNIRAIGAYTAVKSAFGCCKAMIRCTEKVLGAAWFICR